MSKDEALEWAQICHDVNENDSQTSLAVDTRNPGNDIDREARFRDAEELAKQTNAP